MGNELTVRQGCANLAFDLVPKNLISLLKKVFYKPLFYNCQYIKEMWRELPFFVLMNFYNFQPKREENLRSLQNSVCISALKISI